MKIPRLRPLGISARLFCAILISATVSITVSGVVTRLAFERGFLGYLNNLAEERLSFVLPRAAQAYASHGNWDFLRQQPRHWFELIRPTAGEELPADWTPESGLSPLSDLTGAMLRLSLIDVQGQWVAGYRNLTDRGPRRAIMVAGQTVGWIVLEPFQSVADGGDQRFQEGQRMAGWLALGVGLMLAALVAWTAARQLVRPIKQVARATHALAQGDHAVKVEIERQDEVGQLARDFNHLALTLSRNAASRREFIADISHELRTPLSVLRSELQLLADGLRPLDQSAIQSLLDETEHLSALVSDLDQLALSDLGAMRYHMVPLDLSDVLERVTESHRSRLVQGGLSFAIDGVERPAPLEGDEARLRQMLDNLIENARRYTDAPGQVRLRLASTGPDWQIVVEDSAPGVPAHDIPRLFERFFRVDRSRNRAAGGSGLGLAICRNIALAHGGDIAASASPLGGLRISVTLPRMRGTISS
ncbi:ATP-binding protein [Hylemonella gracilis]|nr:ATP-binding protein [Hylemonella gracilis]